MKLPQHKTKIVCTIGPASRTPEIMQQMIRAGMDIARLNFSHGDFDSHSRVIKDLRSAAQSVGKRLAIMGDLPGPKMRIGELSQEAIELKPGDTFTLTSDDITGDERKVSVSFKKLPQSVKAGDMLYLNDGIIQLEVLEVKGSNVICSVLVGGELRSRKGLNLPGIDLGISAFTDRDHECLKFAAENGLDAVCQSFVVSGEDIGSVRKAAGDLDYHPFIVAKIERSAALTHIEDILAATDGVMIARGDLGVEIPIERIAMVQKELMAKAIIHGKPVITATQMLESMTENRRPTRAEVTDVSNAILDGTDCVMLSGESAMGRYPVEAAAMLARIAAATEPYGPGYRLRERLRELTEKQTGRISDMVVFSIEATYKHISPAAVFVPTHSGVTARSIARFRLPVWIVALSRSELTCQQLQFSSGVLPTHKSDPPHDWREYVRSWLHEHEVKGDLVILAQGPSRSNPTANHCMEIIDLRSE
jgi:pyruvate kinase